MKTVRFLNSKFNIHNSVTVHLDSGVAPVAGTALRAQQANTPHGAYVFPAGGRQGATFEVKVGGQFLANVTNAYISGDGVQAVVTDYDRPLTGAQLTQLREQQKALQDKRAAAQAARNGGAPAVSPFPRQH